MFIATCGSVEVTITSHRFSSASFNTPCSGDLHDKCTVSHGIPRSPHIYSVDSSASFARRTFLSSAAALASLPALAAPAHFNSSRP